ncbi:hypothetical protein AB0M86_46790 [Streptomyces sp. NPDC051639]|uniref:hypothetical protein n=1 Tax=Streptomyces sp. NPDC051639 TaxID=3155671 RepID=UPI003422F781
MTLEYASPPVSTPNKLKPWHGIATRYDKTPDSYPADLHLRAAMIWIDDLIKTTE